MTGPQHYLEAERLLAHLGDSLPIDEATATTDLHAKLAAAQVHATLALAAATAEPTTIDPSQRKWPGSAWWQAVQE